MIKRIIFDIDGTLIKGVKFITFIEDAFKKININPNKSEIFNNNIKLYEQIYNKYDKQLFTEFMSVMLDEELYKNPNWLPILFESLSMCINPNNKINDMLNLLNEYELVLLSNFFEESQRKRLSNMGINNYFKKYYGEKIIKPNKEAYEMACGLNAPEECVMVGDNELLDILVPHNMGLKTIYIGEKNNIGDINLKNVEEITPQLIKKLY